MLKVIGKTRKELQSTLMSLVTVLFNNETNFCRWTQWVLYLASLWVGLKDDGSNANYRWLDGTPLIDNSMWGPPDPNNAADLCVFYAATENLLYDASCGTPQNFVCEVETGRS